MHSTIVTIRSVLAILLLGFVIASCGLGEVVEPLEIVSVEAVSNSPQLVVEVAHRSCGVEPAVFVDQGEQDVIVSAEMRARDCNDIRVETESLVDMGKPLGDRTMVVRSVGGDPNCLIDGERSLRCAVLLTSDD